MRWKVVKTDLINHGFPVTKMLFYEQAMKALVGHKEKGSRLMVVLDTNTSEIAC